MSFTRIAQTFADYWPMFLRGSWSTLYISIIGTVIGSFIGLLIGVIRTIPVPERGVKKIIIKIINAILSAYIALFRGTPMIVQAVLIYYGSAEALHIDMNKTFAAIFIVSINTGAYMSEIVRGGIISVDRGQFEAAQAIGMNHIKTMRYIVMPQVIRNILPATGNEFVINIKDTSVLSVIAVSELFYQSKSIVGTTFHYYDTFFITCIIYFIMTFTVTKILRFAEKKLDGPDNYILLGNQMQVEKPEDGSKRAAK